YEEKGRTSCLVKTPGRRVGKVLCDTVSTRMPFKLSPNDATLNEVKIIFWKTLLAVTFSAKGFWQIHGVNSRGLQVFCHLSCSIPHVSPDLQPRFWSLCD